MKHMKCVLKAASFGLFLSTVLFAEDAEKAAWEKHAQIMQESEGMLNNVNDSDALRYTILTQECEKLRSTLHANKKKIYQDLKIVEYKSEHERVLLDSHVFDEMLKNFKIIIDSSLENKKKVEEELAYAQKYSSELKQVYNAIIAAGVTRSAVLAEGRVDLEDKFEKAIEARKKFLKSIDLLVQETEETVDTLLKEVSVMDKQESPETSDAVKAENKE